MPAVARALAVDGGDASASGCAGGATRWRWPLRWPTSAASSRSNGSPRRCPISPIARWTRRFARAMLERLPDEEPRGLAILALGKLGSRELNYSSDVDLVLLFDPETLAAAAARRAGRGGGALWPAVHRTDAAADP